MTVMESKLAELLSAVPYEQLRDDSYTELKEKGTLTGDLSDIGTFVAQMMFNLRTKHEEQLAREVIHLVVRQVRKNLSEGVMDWYTNRVFIEKVSEELGSVDLGEAATA